MHRLMLVAALAAGPALASDAPVPLEDFFRHPAVSSAVMSPSGREVAAAMRGGPQNRMRLVVLNLQDWSQSRLLAGFADADVQTIRWVNDNRLVFTLTDTQSPLGEQWGEGLFAVDSAGKTAAQRLIKRRESLVVEQSSRRELSGWHRLRALLRDGSNDVIVSKYEVEVHDQPSRQSLLRLDTVSGLTRPLTADAPPHTLAWALDRQGVPRVAVAVRDGKTRVHWKTGADAAWTMVAEHDTFDTGGLEPLVVTGGQTLYAIGPPNAAADTSALLRLNLADGKLAARRPLIEVDGYDFAGGLVLAADGELLGVRYAGDVWGTHWFDTRLRAIQAQVDKLLPDTSNQLDCGDCADPAIVLVTAVSDRQPGRLVLFDTKAGTLKALASARPWIKPSQMAERELHHFNARDGLRIPVHVTRPKAPSAAAPTVVLVHGGPHARARGWAWDDESQFLASRGYVVVEPDFRGSTGHGARHLRAGFRQWGLAMQDDIADTALWAAKQGFADARRICLMGASYGGYATLMGLIRHPEIFRCGVQAVGVTDLDLMFTSPWSDLSDMVIRYGLPVMIGDPVKDAAQFAATSPSKQAHRLKQPLLMAYGGEDRRVPIEHGQRMRDALRPHNPNVEWVSYADEGHGWMLEASRFDYYRRVERFLEAHLKNPRP